MIWCHASLFCRFVRFVPPPPAPQKREVRGEGDKYVVEGREVVPPPPSAIPVFLSPPSVSAAAEERARGRGRKMMFGCISAPLFLLGP